MKNKKTTSQNCKLWIGGVPARIMGMGPVPATKWV